MSEYRCMSNAGLTFPVGFSVIEKQIDACTLIVVADVNWPSTLNVQIILFQKATCPVIRKVPGHQLQDRSVKARGGELQEAKANDDDGGDDGGRSCPSVTCPSVTPPDGGLDWEACRGCRSKEPTAGPPMGEESSGGKIKLKTTLEPAISANTPFPNVNTADPTQVPGSV